MIICEIGQNHCGDTQYADQYVGALLKVPPDAITFQFRERGYYQEGVGAGFVLPDSYYERVVAQIKENDVKFGMTLCDPSRIGFCEEIGTDFYKIPSKDINNDALVMKVLGMGKRVFVSTGMSNMDEIDAFIAKTKRFQGQITLIHTQLTYELNEVNLRAIDAMRRRFGLPVAFGSHSPNINTLYVALGFEPSDIFFYVRGNKKGVYHGDKRHAVLLSRYPEVIKSLRELPATLGREEKIKMGNRIQRNHV